MKFFVAASLLAVAFAAPAELDTRTDRPVCPNGLFSNPLCCATDVLGVACLDGGAPDQTPRDGRDFRDICAKKGQQARCCVLPVAGQGVLCTSVVGTN
ncbi:hypothetical protein VHEMI01639 [[Torrubiella] hemipterigena]|uniref:Hydrophobin n=1 Tax=[Torrubiella] hemipterigena TaxID=1531966 RepID=A0A0A1SME8_9HYPO|nr:hypothetical protein VHEMI01639 [[Torrubiella] hemipterigena]